MKETFTKKLYYKKWDHKVIFRASTEWVSSRNPIAKTRVHPFLVYDAIDIKLDVDQYRTLESSAWSKKEYAVTVFFKDPEVLELLKEKFDYAIESIEKPASPAHSEALEKERLIIREKLYYDTYRCAVRIKPDDGYDENGWNSRYQQFDELKKWVASTQKTCGRSGSDHVRINKEWNMTIFYKDPADAMLFRLTWPDCVKHVDRIKLITEL
jgi:hypothetical protein